MNTRKARLKQLDKQRRKIQETINKLEQDEFEQVELPKLKKMLNKCFKYKNSYSCPQTESDYWWKYFRVLSVDKDGVMRCLCFEQDCHGVFTMEVNKTFIYHEGIISISAQELLDAYLSFMSRANKELYQ